MEGSNWKFYFGKPAEGVPSAYKNKIYSAERKRRSFGGNTAQTALGSKLSRFLAYQGRDAKDG